MGTAIKHPMPGRVKPSFVIFDIRALWRCEQVVTNIFTNTGSVLQREDKLSNGEQFMRWWWCAAINLIAQYSFDIFDSSNVIFSILNNAIHVFLQWYTRRSGALKANASE